jgi:hypothetical protein
MTSRFAISAITILAIVAAQSTGVAYAQTAAPLPSRQGSMASMPGMGTTQSADMNTQMKQCAQMRAQMKAGAKMTPDMQPMMDRCDKMDRSMGATKAPDDTLSR